MRKVQKVAIVRAASLNNGEMQNYLPLVNKYEVLAIGSQKGAYEFNLPIKTRKLICFGEALSMVPKGIAMLYYVFGDPQGIIGLEKVISGYDIVSTVERTNYYTLQAVRAKKKGLVKRVVVTCWENISGLHQQHSAQRRMKEEIAIGADWFIAGTHMAKKVLLEEGVSEKKITVIPFGINLDQFCPQTGDKRFMSHFGIPINRKKVLFAARLVREKGIREFFFAARKIVKKRERGIMFLVTGAGNEESWLKEIAHKERLSDNFIFIPHLPYDTLNKVYLASDVFVLPSIPTENWQEQFGLVLVEAMACGTPVIASETGSISEVVGNAALLVPPKDINALADAIEKVLETSHLRSSMRQQGLQRVRRCYDRNMIADRIDKLYQSLL
ncbi:MAG: glycosyltransferase family 4 protein [Candidatus Levybacteria bacterium]|nr:glycosyltransferase family 4 protein [Candidatus Levybacteria bacterium]